MPVSVTSYVPGVAGTVQPYACPPRETLALVLRTTFPSRSRRIVMPTRETFDSSKRTSAYLRARSRLVSSSIAGGCFRSRVYAAAVVQ